VRDQLSPLARIDEFSKRSPRERNRVVVGGEWLVGEDFKPRSNSERRLSNRSPRLHCLDRRRRIRPEASGVVFPTRIPYACFIVSEYGGFEREAGPFVKLWAAVCSVFGWRCRCPRCGGKMVRRLAPDRSYVREKRRTTRMISLGRGKSYVYRAPHPPLRIRITPMYDVCETCGHRIRRGTMRTTRTRL
jgi:hypothetical protein